MQIGVTAEITRNRFFFRLTLWCDFKRDSYSPTLAFVGCEITTLASIDLKFFGFHDAPNLLLKFGVVPSLKARCAWFARLLSKRETYRDSHHGHRQN